MLNAVLSRTRVAATTAAFIGGIAAATIGTDAWHDSRIERNQVSKIVKSFEQNTVPAPAASELQCSRAKIEGTMKERIQNPGLNWVTGEPGTGKTSLLTKVCSQIGSGIIYADIKPTTSEKTLISNLGLAVGYDLDHSRGLIHRIRSKLWPISNERNDMTLSMLLADIRQAAEIYYAKHNRPASLVIDDFTNALVASTEAYEELVHFAKEEAKGKNLGVTFVSDYKTPRLWNHLSEDSKPEVIEVGDIPENLATDLVIRREGEKLSKVGWYDWIKTKVNLERPPSVDAREAEQIVKVTGGRLQLLLDSADKRYLDKVPLREVLEKINKRTRNDLEQAGLGLPSESSSINQTQKKIWDVMANMIDSPDNELPTQQVWNTLDTATDELINNHILSFHPSRNTIGFESKPMAIAVSEIVGEKGSKKREKFKNTLEPPKTA